jgi:competence protein ComEA
LIREVEKMIFYIGGREINLGKHLIAVLMSFLLTAAAVTGYFLLRNESQLTVYTAEEAGSGTELTETNTQNAMNEDLEGAVPAAEEKKEKIKVYVVGRVNKPGVVTLDKGEIVDEAVKAAGGATSDADLESINLAYELTENVMIKIGSRKSPPTAKTNVPVKAQTSEGSRIISDSGGAVVDEKTSSDKNGGKVNINTATAAELDTLPGIGEATAQKIIAHREKNGKFKSGSDIMKVSGIGQSKYNSLKDFISAE